MASSTDPLSETVSAAVIGRALKLSSRRITQLRDEGRIPGADGGKFVLGDAIGAYCEFMRFGERPTDADGDLDFTQERARLARAQREGHDLKNSVLRSELLPLDDMEAVVGNLLEAVRTKMLALPTKMAPRCLGLTSMAEARDLLTGMVHDALNDLADTSIVVADISDRARRRIGRASSDGALDADPAGPASADGQRLGG